MIGDCIRGLNQRFPKTHIMRQHLRQYLSKAFRWQRGRQQSGYDKMLLLQGMLPLPFDVYLLRFPEGAEIKAHVDTVDSGQHYRLNLVLKEAAVGGEFRCQSAIFASRRIKLFRPDVSEHSVSLVGKGVRYVFSVGWVRNAVPAEPG